MFKLNTTPCNILSPLRVGRRMYVCVEEPEAITLSSEAVLRYYRGTIEAPLRYVGRDKKGLTHRVGLANVSPKGLYHVMRG